jgi:hypothetical protein
MARNYRSRNYTPSFRCILRREKERLGWTAAMIVTVGGFKDFQKWSCEELALKGPYLKDRNELLRYLDGYKQHANGLWLSDPRTDL